MTTNSGKSKLKSNISYFKSFLEQKVGNIFSSWKKNYYICLEGIALIYTQNQESKIVLGHIPISNMSLPESLDSRVFQFESEEKIYILKASNPEEKEKWMKFLSNKIKEKEFHDKDIKERNPSILSEDIKINKNKNGVLNNGPNKKSIENEKVSSISKRIARIIKSYGYIINQEEELSNQILEEKGITNLINIKDPKIKTRIHHGFLYKKHKAHDYFQKRWFFILSSRPLFDKEYIQDDLDLDPKKQKEWIKFDTLYYFKYQNKPEFKENLGGLEMVNSHKILYFENNEKYYLNLDVGDRIYDFYCDNRFDRDEWFEVLKNSRRTAKEYFSSKTKKPRNIELLNLYFRKGEKDFIKKMENEKKNLVGNYEEIMEYEVFQFNQNSLKELILSTIDGCLSNIPVNKDLLKGYAEYMLKEYLEIVKSFWERLYNKIQHDVILKMGMLLLNFRESLLELNIDDANLYKNGKELIKIYFKKTYQNILSVIESILKSEREIKGVKSEAGELQTHGPVDLFGFLSKTFDLVKETYNKTVYKELLLLFKESIKQYLIGIDTVLTNMNIVMENEYLIAVANNSFNMITFLNNLIDDMRETKILTVQEINEGLQNKKLMYIINKVSQNSISSFVSQFRLELGKEFKNINYIDLEMEKILIKTFDIFGKFKPLMNILIIKKCWNEILKLTLYHYITCLLMTANKNQKSVEQLRQKINYDTKILTETYEPVVGTNLTKSTLKIMNDLYDFLDVSSYMISHSCLTLRQYIGNSFSISTIKALIKLRSDFSSEEKNDAIEQCKDVLSKYNEPDNNNLGGYFQYMEKELKRQEREEKKQEMNKLSQKSIDTSRNSLMHSKTFINFNEQNQNKSESEEEDNEEEEKQEQPLVGIELTDFLNDDSEEEEKNEENEENIKKIEVEVSESLEYKEVSDIEYEGYMYKKSHTKWQKRYFQLKNGHLYWFIDNKSSIIQNKISIKDTEKVVSHKDKKFLMIVKESDEAGKIFKAKEYKFMCESEEQKIEWVLAITNSMKKLNISKILKKEEKLDIKIRKKIIHDLFKLPEINKENTYMRKKVLDAMNNENYFKPSQRKIEADRKKALKEEEEKKRQEKLEIERKKKEEKEEKERVKREEKERKLKEEREKNKQIEKDIREGKNVGVKNRIKFWFKGLGRGDQQNEEKEENQINENKNNSNKENKVDEDKNGDVNNFNIDDFMNADSEENEKNEEGNKKEIEDNEDKKYMLNKELKIERKEDEKIKEQGLDTYFYENNNKEIENNNKIISIDDNKNDKEQTIIDKDEKAINKNNDYQSNIKERNNNYLKNQNVIKELNVQNELNKEVFDNKKEEKFVFTKKITEEETKEGEEKEKFNNNKEKILDEEDENINLKDMIKNDDINSEKEIDLNIGNYLNNENSKLNNAFFEFELYSDEESKEEEKKKEKKSFFANLFICNSTNERRNNREKKKKEKKSEQELIKEEIKQIKKEQDEIKLQKMEMEKEMKQHKEIKKRLNKKKFTIIEEEKSFDEEEDKEKNKEEDIENNIKQFEKEELKISYSEKLENEFEKKQDLTENQKNINFREEIKEKNNEIKEEKKNIILRNKRKKRSSILELEADKISEKSKESDDEDKEKEEKINLEEESNLKNDNKSNFENNISNYNKSIEIQNLLKKEEKKSFNRYSENRTFSNHDCYEEENDSNNIVNFLGISKSNNEFSPKIISEDDEDEKEYLNSNINKKIIEYKDNIGIIFEKKEEDEEFEEQREKFLNKENILRKASLVNIMEAKHLLNNDNDINNKDNKINKEFISSISHKLIKKTKKADKIMNGMKNNYNQNKLDEKIAKIRKEIPNIKTRYEIHLEEEKTRNEDNIIENNKEFLSNENMEGKQKVNDWWNGIFT